MKKITILLAALLGAMLWTGCKDTLETDDPTNPGEKPVAARDSVMLTIEAGKGFDTKALALVTENEKDKINAFWVKDEEVKVFSSESAVSIGTLTATPVSGDATKATLSGTINKTGLAKGQTLTLLFPSATWGYDNQSGTLESIASKFDFARTQVTIENVSETQITTTTKPVTFVNEQNIYRFGFRYGTVDGPTIRTKTLLLTSNQDKLANTVDARTGANTYFAAGVPMTIELSPALDVPSATDHPLIYVAIRNDNKSTKDTFSFTIYDADGATYKGSKDIPSDKLSSHFVSAKTIPLNRLEVSQGSTSVATAL
ncbi:MAG: hypothetical protein J5835_02050 [Bacteroidales bacterium]|nr:hypothetical protein [Bacteroidales bacterium]